MNNGRLCNGKRSQRLERPRQEPDGILLNAFEIPESSTCLICPDIISEQDFNDVLEYTSCAKCGRNFHMHRIQEKLIGYLEFDCKRETPDS